MAATTILAILGLAIMTQTAPETRNVAISYRPETPIKAVSVIGDFNHWDPLENPMTKGVDGLWTTRFDIKMGAHSFKLRLDNGQTILAPGYPTKKDLGGNVNSLLLANPVSFDANPGAKGDGIITEAGLRHRATPDDIGRIDKDHFWLRLRTRANDVEEASIVTGSERSPTHVVNSDGVFDTWQGSFIPGKGQVKYGFEVKDGATVKAYGQEHIDFDKWPMPDVPEWANGAVYYQIFPDRFDNGDKSNDGEAVDPWGSKPTFRNRMGGDLRGIINHLAYLKDLGVQCLYLTPIFKSGTNHGYDTYDYMLVDPRFGTNEELKELVAKAHANGMKVILDAVFNHSGTRFFAFENLRFHGETSDYKGWYFVTKYPLEVQRGQKTYRTFSTTPMMPKLNTDNPATKRYLLNVVRYWTTFADLDGWRLDVADEVSQDFWRDFRKLVKGIKKDAVIIGEIWPDAHEWLQGDQHDSVMNYRWREATLNFFVNPEVSSQAFEENLHRVRKDYPEAVLNNLYLLLDSHDTKRLRNELHGNKDLAELAVAFQMAYPGSPAIYYGDEVGMEGDRDPDCRRCMNWDPTSWDQDLLALYKSLTHARQSEPALRSGSYQWLSKGVFGFVRKEGRTEIRVYINRSEAAAKVSDKGALLVGKGAKLANGSLSLEPLGFAYIK